MSAREDDILEHAGIILDAVALSQAVLDGDLAEARFRASRVTCHAEDAGRDTVARSAAQVVDVLTPAQGIAAVGIGQAIERMPVAIDEAQGLG